MRSDAGKRLNVRRQKLGRSWRRGNNKEATRTEARFEREGIVKYLYALVARFVACDRHAHAIALRRAGATIRSARRGD